MDSNTYSTADDDLGALAAVVDTLANRDLSRLSDAVAAQRVLVLRGLLERLEGQWLRELAGVDGRGAAGSEQDQPAPSTASWLRNRLRLGNGAARQAVRTARALFRGPLTDTATALAAGEVSSAHAAVLANGTSDLPAAATAEAEPVLLEAARRLDPPRLRRAIAHLRYVADPDRAEQEQQRRYERRGLWLSSSWEGMVALEGLLDPEAGQTVLAALEPLARPSDAGDERSGWQRNADALVELARRSLEGGRLPKAGGVRPQLLVTVDLATLLGQEDSLGGELGWTGNLGAETCRRLACDSSLTRLLVMRNPTHQDPGDHSSHQHGNHQHLSDHSNHHQADGGGRDGSSSGHGSQHHGRQQHQHLDGGGWQASSPVGWDGATSHPSGNGKGWGGSQPGSGDGNSSNWDSSEPNSWNGHGNGHGWDGNRWDGGDGIGDGMVEGGLAARLQAALRLLPVALGGAPTRPLEVGRANRVIAPAQRSALTVRDGGCVFPGCDRPQEWCEGHHLRHWLQGGPTDLGNLALLCRAHHRAVHEGGWRLQRDPDGQMTAIPPPQRQPTTA